MSDRRRSPSPSKPGGSSRRSSQSPARSRADSASRSSAAGPPPGWTQGPGFDPARAPRQEKGNTRMELPPDAYVSDTKKDLFTLRGNKLNTEGKPEMIEVNQYRMSKFDFNKKIYQYDIILSPEPDKIGPVMKKLWAHPKLQAQLRPYKGDKWLFDGKKLAWAPVLVERGEIRCKVDLDEGKRPPDAKPRPGADFLVTIRKTTEVKVAALQGYLEHKISFNNTVQEALNFLDHLVRQWPSQHLLSIKRNFYKQSAAGIPLNDGAIVEVHKGGYASVRMSHNMARGGVGLGYNIDVANTCFWIGGQSMDKMVCNFLATCDRQWQGMTPITVANQLRPVQNKGRLESSDAFKQLRKLRRLRFKVRHSNRRNDEKIYTVIDFLFKEEYGLDGATARTHKFEHDGAQISVQEYYRKKYNVNLRFSNLPLIDAGKGGMIPMELAWVEPMQRYPFKLNPDQTAAMIKIAVTRPSVRKSDIVKNAMELQIGSDPFLKEYGVNFETQFAKTEARILPPPAVKFQGGGIADPKFSGRWDLRGKKFWKQNMVPLKSWGFVALEQGVPFPVLQQFANTFKTTFMGHGGKVLADPKLLNPPGQMRFNAAEAIAWAHEEITKSSGYTQLLFLVVSKKNSGSYERLKKSADCRFGILTQVIVSNHVHKNNGQYHSNVCMKVNAKLGGATSCVKPPWNSPNTYFPESRPTMIIGVDVSHGAPGGNTPSTAAMTMSVDRDATRYAAMVETNGYRVEMLTPSNIRMMFGQLSGYWRKGHNGAVPAHIIYMRDGVGEGQFAYVLDQEISEIKEFLKGKIPPNQMPKFTVIVATKRHHIRFFPQKGDRNGNPLPGTLVEKEVTHPFMWDFYLNSHVAIQGTARPVHYHVILDEMNVPVNDFQKMIYQQCYTYARSTTPVSLHPAVYYAHLASARARAHENIASSEGFRAGPKGHEMIREKIARGISPSGGERGVDAPPLLTLGGKVDKQKGPVSEEEQLRDFFRSTMWYI
ncbi:Piwi domain-containing protein [Mariannaea sp. PMI_226]|nr:Piwi domain-containing protein [Mariannaea sp. PMI_226]